MPEATLPPVTREKAAQAFHELRRQAADVPEMTLDEINEEIAAARAERVETPEDTAAHIQAMKEYKAGETIALEDINWN